MRITIHPAAMSPPVRYLVERWYDDQDERLNEDELPPWPWVSAIVLVEEGQATVVWDPGFCVAPDRLAEMVCDSLPPVVPGMPGVHLDEAAR